MNENLCRALLQARLTEEDVATRLQVDPKTVRRWLEGRVPYLRHRWALAASLGLDEADLWPQMRRTRSRPDEVQAIYPRLDAVPEDAWLRLVGSAKREIGILADTALPIVGYPRVLAVLDEKAVSGVGVRICLPDPDDLAVAERSAAHASSSVVAGRLREGLANLAPLNEIAQAEIRLHRAVLYNSIWYADDAFLISQHAYSIPSSDGPVLYLRRTEDGDMASGYLASFEAVWAHASPRD